MTYSLSLGSKMMQQSPMGPAKLSMMHHSAPAIEKVQDCTIDYLFSQK